MTIEDVLAWVRPHVLALKPYSSARDEFSGVADVYLDANENSLGAVAHAADWHRYPDPHASAIKHIIAALKGVKPAQIFVGNGSDEAIDLLYRVFCAPGQASALLMPPTYGMYGVSAAINAIETVQVPLNQQFQIDRPALQKVLEQRHDLRLVFVCSPNNPTGNLLDKADITWLLDHFNGIVVVDEAYIDFCPEASWVPVLNQYPNLVVVQTLSKAWGLASLRMGLAYAHEQVIALLNKVKPPYNLSGPAQEAALLSLSQAQEKDHKVAEILTLRQQLLTALRSVPCIEHIYSTDANFVLVRLKATWNATQVYQDLTKAGIVVRDRSSQVGCENCLRITVGTAAENQKLLAALLSVE